VQLDDSLSGKSLQHALSFLPQLAAHCQGSLAKTLSDAVSSSVATVTTNRQVHGLLLPKEIIHSPIPHAGVAEPGALSQVQFSVITRSLTAIFNDIAPAFRNGALTEKDKQLTGMNLLFYQLDLLLRQPLVWSRFIVWFAQARSAIG
jgi:hypothetical protein